jgi:bacteriocin-like protein
MKKEENKKQEELNDEQLNQINGGYTEEAISKMKIPPL